MAINTNSNIKDNGIFQNAKNNAVSNLSQNGTTPNTTQNNANGASSDGLYRGDAQAIKVGIPKETEWNEAFTSGDKEKLDKFISEMKTASDVAYDPGIFRKRRPFSTKGELSYIMSSPAANEEVKAEAKKQFGSMMEKELKQATLDSLETKLVSADANEVSYIYDEILKRDAKFFTPEKIASLISGNLTQKPAKELLFPLLQEKLSGDSLPNAETVLKSAAYTFDEDATKKFDEIAKGYSLNNLYSAIMRNETLRNLFYEQLKNRLIESLKGLQKTGQTGAANYRFVNDEESAQQQLKIADRAGSLIQLVEEDKNIGSIIDAYDSLNSELSSGTRNNSKQPIDTATTAKQEAAPVEQKASAPVEPPKTEEEVKEAIVEKADEIAEETAEKQATAATNYALEVGRGDVAQSVQEKMNEDLKNAFSQAEKVINAKDLVNNLPKGIISRLKTGGFSADGTYYELTDSEKEELKALKKKRASEFTEANSKRVETLQAQDNLTDEQKKELESLLSKKAAWEEWNSSDDKKRYDELSGLKEEYKNNNKEANRTAGYFIIDAIGNALYNIGASIKGGEQKSSKYQEYLQTELENALSRKNETISSTNKFKFDQLGQTTDAIRELGLDSWDIYTGQYGDILKGLSDKIDQNAWASLTNARADELSVYSENDRKAMIQYLGLMSQSSDAQMRALGTWLASELEYKYADTDIKKQEAYQKAVDSQFKYKFSQAELNKVNKELDALELANETSKLAIKDLLIDLDFKEEEKRVELEKAWKEVERMIIDAKLAEEQTQLVEQQIIKAIKDNKWYTSDRITGYAGGIIDKAASAVIGAAISDARLKKAKKLC